MEDLQRVMGFRLFLAFSGVIVARAVRGQECPRYICYGVVEAAWSMAFWQALAAVRTSLKAG